MINDVRALREPGALAAASELGAAVCLMHMQGEPRSMQDNPSYSNVVGEVIEFLNARVQACRQAGIEPGRMVVDPGFGFGKNLNHNLQLLRNLAKFEVLGLPLLVGISRKGMIGQILGAKIDQRLAGSVACAVMAAMQGAKIVRVHDVGPTVDAMKLVAALEQTKE